MLKSILILISYSSLICFSIGTKQCGITVCFNWRVEVDKLTLICKVNNLHFKVLIEDPVGQLQADCLPPIPESKCTSHFKDRSISQNIKTNETTFILKGNIDSHVNGYWTCRHGTKVDLAKVDVTVLTIKDKANVTPVRNNTKLSKGEAASFLSDESCLFKTVFYAMVSYWSTVTVCLAVMMMINKNPKCIDDILRTNKCCKRYIVCKRLIFAILTASYMAFAALIGWMEKDKCTWTSYWIVCGLAIPFALLCTILLLNKEDNSKTPSHKDDALVGNANQSSNSNTLPHEDNALLGDGNQTDRERDNQISDIQTTSF